MFKPLPINFDQLQFHFSEKNSIMHLDVYTLGEGVNKSSPFFYNQDAHN